ncbi:MAG TPA: autotransporter-associated beta strand repeat-containing protein [Rhizomicrobium sp.]|nr:autotransporter-associated beta strand repeat-containing protein [Rhizomicrobium sp.]
MADNAIRLPAGRLEKTLGRGLLLRSAAILLWPMAIMATPAFAGYDMRADSTYPASALGGSPAFLGGTLQLDTSSTVASNFDVENYSTNTIDADGHAATLSGALTGNGPMTFTDSVGGGNIILTNSGNTYSGATTINSGALVSLSGSGVIATSSSVTANGTLDISGTTSGASIISLAGTGAVNLGAQNLTITDGAGGTFSGTISGTGGLVLTAGTEILSGANTYTGITTINGGTLEIGAGGTTGSIAGNVNVATSGILEFDQSGTVSFGGVVAGAGGLTQAGTGTLVLTGVNTYTGATNVSAGTLQLAPGASIAASSGVAVTGIFDISQTSGASVTSLSGGGTVNLGAETLTLTNGAGTFSGVIQGSGGLTVSGGTQILTGATTYTGATIVTGGTLAFGGTTATYNVSDSGTVGFDSSSAIAMTGVVSGSGGISQMGAGTTTISTQQTFTGPTTIVSGTLALSGAGSIAQSSGVTATGTFDISGTGGASIVSLSGAGTVQLGSQTLTLTDAAGTFSGAIEGAGGIAITAGKETLSGDNGFTGVTTIAGGTLALGSPNSLAQSASVQDNGTLDISGSTGTGVVATITSLGGSGTVLLGTKTLGLSAAADTFSGAITGSGGLTVSGGSEVLSGASSYTGATTITGGTLALSGSGSLGGTTAVADNGVFDISGVTSGPVTVGSLSGSGAVHLGAGTLTLSDASGIFLGVISGSGGLAVTGGTQALGGANLYTGGTTISAGTLQIGASYGNGSILGNVADDGELAFANSNTAIFSGTTSGTGSVYQTGSGTTILTAANSYSGGTVITGGTLQIGNGAAAGSIAGNVNDDSTLAFARTDATVFGGTISGTGGVTAVSGTTTLTAANSYTGATTIDAPADIILSGAGGIAASSVTDNGTLDVSAATAPQIASLAGSGSVVIGGQTLTVTDGAGVFSGAISGSGGLAVTGGTETLSGANSYTGATVINGGNLAVNGAITSSSGVTVNSGGTLSGSGSVPNVTVKDGGAISPGSAGSGTLSVNGTVAFANTSEFVVDMSSAGAGKLSVAGAEALGGTLSVASTDGTYALGQKLTVLTAADGVSGTFAVAPLENTGAVFSQTVSYDADDVYLEVNLAKLSPLLPAGVTANQSQAIAGIDTAIASGHALPQAFENLGNVSPSALASDAGQMSGELGSDIPNAANSLFDPFVNAIFDHIGDTQENGVGARRPPQRGGIWAMAFTGDGIVDGNQDLGSHQFKSDMNGFVGGADFRLSPAMVLGAAFSVGSSTFHLADGFGDGKDKAVQGGIYGFIRYLPRLYGAFTAAFGENDITTDRTIAVSGTDDLTGKAAAGIYGARYEMGGEFGWLIPYVALQDQLVMAPAYSETASSGSDNFALSYLSHNTNIPGAELGVRQNANIPLDPNWSLDFTDRLAWRDQITGTWNARAAYANVTGSDFSSYGAEPGKSSALVDLGLALQSHSGFGLDVQLHGALAGNSQTYEEFAGLNFAW